MRVLGLISLIVVAVSGSKKKQKRGTKIFGKDAGPLFDVSAPICQRRLNCWLVGDPHLKSFYDVYDQVGPPESGILDIYSRDGFHINCTTYSRDLMDNIHFGDEHEWHIDDCKGKQGWLPSLTHQYADGSSIEARVYCRKSRRGKKMHINLLLLKSMVLPNGVSTDDDDLFAGSTGVCTMST